MLNQISFLLVSEIPGVHCILQSHQFERIDEFHVKFDATRNVTLKNVVIDSSYPFGNRIEIDSIDVKLIEEVTATIVDVYGKLETRNVEEKILDLEILDVDEDLSVDDEWIKSILIDQLNDQDRFEKMVGHLSIMAK